MSVVWSDGRSGRRRKDNTHQYVVELAVRLFVPLDGFEPVHGFFVVEVVAAHEGREELCAHLCQ